MDRPCAVTYFFLAFNTEHPMKSLARSVSTAMIYLSTAVLTLPAGAEEVQAATPTPDQLGGYPPRHSR